MMAKEFDIDNLSLDELLLVRSVLKSFEDIDSAKRSVNSEIKKKREFIRNGGLNEQFSLVYMVEWGIFTMTEVSVLYDNGIGNLQELIECDLTKLKGATSEMIRRFDEGRKFFDMRGYTSFVSKGKKRK